MYFSTLIPALVLLTCAPAPAQIAERWLRADHDAAERDALVEDSKKLEFKQVAPILLKVLVECRPMFGNYNRVGDRPWNDKRLPPRQRKFVMAEVVWNHHLRGRHDPAKAKVLLSLLPKGDANTHGRYLVVAVMTHSQWIPEMEPVLKRMLTDETRTADARRAALNCLLHRGDINTYMPICIKHIQSSGALITQLREYNLLTNQGNRLFTLSEANRRSLVDLGFKLLERLSHKQHQSGYFVALQLGFLLKIKDQFKPDQDAEEYQSPSGLTDAFFTDTVKNALAWKVEDSR